MDCRIAPMTLLRYGEDDGRRRPESSTLMCSSIVDLVGYSISDRLPGSPCHDAPASGRCRGRGAPRWSWWPDTAATREKRSQWVFSPSMIRAAIAGKGRGTLEPADGQCRLGGSGRGGHGVLRRTATPSKSRPRTLRCAGCDIRPDGPRYGCNLRRHPGCFLRDQCRK